MKFSEENSIQILKDEVLYRKYKSGVYFLVDDTDEVVYVGQARNLDTRPFEHKDKNFSKIFAIPCHRDDLSDSEFKYIVKYLPVYNRSLPRSTEYPSLMMIKSHAHSSMPNEKCIELFDKKKIEYLSVKLPSRDCCFYYVHISKLIRAINAVKPIEEVDLNSVCIDSGKKNKIILHPTILNELGWDRTDEFNLSYDNYKIIITKKEKGE